MSAEEQEMIVARHEMKCLELKESFNVECIETAWAFTVRGRRVLPVSARWASGCGGMV